MLPSSAISSRWSLYLEGFCPIVSVHQFLFSVVDLLNNYNCFLSTCLGDLFWNSIYQANSSNIFKFTLMSKMKPDSKKYHLDSSEPSPWSYLKPWEPDLLCIWFSQHCYLSTFHENHPLNPDSSMLGLLIYETFPRAYKAHCQGYHCHGPTPGTNYLSHGPTSDTNCFSLFSCCCNFF